MKRPSYIDKIKQSKRIVIKVGTSTLAYNSGKPDLRHIDKLCRVISDLQNSGKEIVLVSSGAVAVGMGKLNEATRPDDMAFRQALAAIGQCELMFIYDKLFGEYSNRVAQVLVTEDVIDEPKTRRNIVNTLEALIHRRVIPIVNENDTVATDELEGKNIGDNDTLSAYVAKLIAADALVLLTDIDALYDKDPHTNEHAQRIPVVTEINDTIVRLAGPPGSKLGTGGMATKIHAAQISTAENIPCWVIQGDDADNLYKLIDGEDIGTVFLPPQLARQYLEEKQDQ